MTENEWDDVITAYKLLKQGKMKKIEGKGWSMYTIGLVIRLDIKE
jgi:hypothetical protein